MYQLHQTHSQLRFSKSCLSTFGLLSGCSCVKKLLALLLVLGACEFVTPCPNSVRTLEARAEIGLNHRFRCQHNRINPCIYKDYSPLLATIFNY